jgi:uncharacterized protein YkwD
MLMMAVATAVASLLLAGSGLQAQESRPPEEPTRVPAPGRADIPTGVAEMEQQVVDRTNAIRRDDGVAPLALDATLARLAREHSCRMAGQQFFAHGEPAGGDLPARLRAAGASFEMAGENIARTTDANDPVEAAIQGWMKSQGHRTNILQPAFTRTGVGVCREGPIYFFTQIFLRSGGA